jgi:diguanylate cyclase (GGDEF)-like protein/PAS domain S-box-containing protein
MHRILKRLRVLTSGHELTSLSTGIIIAMCAGLLLPALIGGLVLTGLRQEQIDKEAQSHLDDKVQLLAKSLVDPLWNVDTRGARTIADASMLDPQVVRITVKDPYQENYLNIERPERRLGVSRLARRDLMHGSERVGSIEVETDNGLRQMDLRQDRRAYFSVLLGQILLSLVLILLAVRLRILRPLARLTDFSNQLASGNLEHPLSWQQSDEIGRLAGQLDQMRHGLRTAFAEQEAILNNVQVGVLFLRERSILLANRHAEQIFGYAPGAMVGQSTQIIYLSDNQYSTIGERAYSSIGELRGRYEEEVQLKRQDGSTFLSHMRGCALDPEVPEAGSIWVVEDITQRKSAEEKIRHLAFYDTLTELPNRRLILDRLGHALISSARHHKHCALLLIDLDNFKSLNDTQGHDVGDQLLIAVAARLAASIRQVDTVARMGGDEFMVLLEDLDEAELAAVQAESVARKIIAGLNEPYLLNVNLNGNTRHQHSHHSTSSIGITLFCGDAVSVDELMKRADTAMYQAKAAGRNTLRFFDPAMQAVVTARASMEKGLHQAIEKQQFLLHYQAQVNAAGLVLGAEVLLRWQDPERGLVSPAEFIPLAEETGLILPIGQWVLETACQQLAAWSTRLEMADLTIAVNVSARQFHHKDFVSQVLAVLDQTGANPRRLKLELTESLLVDDVEAIITKMGVLKKKGVGFSLDDFGTGYSSLSYLKRLPLDQLKIDQSFVHDISTDPNDAAIVRAVVALAQNLGLTVIAEGVETTAQRDFLASHGCQHYQGYYFSRPLPLEEFEQFCRTPLN